MKEPKREYQISKKRKNGWTLVAEHKICWAVIHKTQKQCEKEKEKEREIKEMKREEQKERKK
jgi:hypothetical protein